MSCEYRRLLVVYCTVRWSVVVVVTWCFFHLGVNERSSARRHLRIAARLRVNKLVVIDVICAGPPMLPPQNLPSFPPQIHLTSLPNRDDDRMTEKSAPAGAVRPSRLVVRAISRRTGNVCGRCHAKRASASLVAANAVMGHSLMESEINSNLQTIRIRSMLVLTVSATESLAITKTITKINRIG